MDNWHWDQAKADALLYKANHSKDYQESKDAALAYAEMIYQRKIHNPELITNPPPSEWPFPNYQTGLGRPLPVRVNFYAINDHYPAYLLCQYDVKEKYYNQTNEPGWFKAPLKQIRHSGSKNFPPIKWVSVMIVDRGEFKDASTWEKCCKVGAIFKASDVFDSSCKLSQLIAHAEMDRHPYLYDQQQPTPGEQQRWLIVERHAATNPPTTGSK